MLRATPLGPESPYLGDESKMTGSASLLLSPECEADVIEAVRRARESGEPLTVSGMRTGMCGGCVPMGGAVLTMERMGGIRGIGRDGRGFFVRVGPAATIREINEALRSGAPLASATPGAAEEMPRGAYFYPVDPTELNGSIGGNIATNASGPRTLKYGPTRDWVRRVRLVMSDGSVLDVKRGDRRARGRVVSVPMGGGPVEVRLPSYEFNTRVKNTAGLMSADGMDLVDLFVGSEGTLGIITEADLYLAERHPLISNIFFFPSDADAYAFVRDLRGSSADPEFLEFLDSGSLDLIRGVRERDRGFTSMPDLPESARSAVFMDLEMDGRLAGKYREIGVLAERRSGSLDDSWCGHELRDRERFFGLRHSVPRTVFEYVAGLKRTVPGIHKMATDMSVPLDRLDEMVAANEAAMDAHGLERVTFGHIGNGHLHLEIILKDMRDMEEAKIAYRELAAKAIELGGSPSAEHGIGKMKREFLLMLYGEAGVEEMREVKRALDPAGVLSPGNMAGP
ncbi:MAG: FAD-binding oxidoreductase [Candidatus Methanoplasma sp.]|jgi:D-lactate dehydrogenase (cytochrome)|nr:FAD-binding oxidoreductase [Candidatus Methanoplasma sp.]